MTSRVSVTSDFEGIPPGCPHRNPSGRRSLGLVAYEQGDCAAARPLFEESLAISRELGDKTGIAYALNHLGLVAYAQDDYAAARSLIEESLAIQPEREDKRSIAYCLHHLGLVVYQQGDYVAARSLHAESLTLRRELGNKPGIANSLEGLARLAAQGREWERAARLWGAAAALRAAIGVPVAPNWRDEWERELGAARAALGEAAFAAAWAEGRAMSQELAVSYALESRPLPEDASQPP